MNYRVIISPQVEAEVERVFQYIAAAHQDYFETDRWLSGFKRAILRLETFPNGYGYARELDTLGRPLRQLIYKSYRIVFEVQEDERKVTVLFVRHAARRALGEEEASD